MTEVNHAIILAAGLGSRMIPASIASPKETLPLIDIPIITHTVSEAYQAGVKHIHLVLSEGKEYLADIAKGNTILGKRLSKKIEHLHPLLIKPCGDAEVHVHIQEEPKGVANAIYTALPHIDGPFLVLMADNALIEKNTTFFPSSSSKMIVNQWNQHNCPIIGILKIPESRVENYGVIEKNKQGFVQNILEKPSFLDTKSRFIACGRYLFPSSFSDIYKQFDFEDYGELQSIKILEWYMKSTKGLKVIDLNNFNLYDSGKPIEWLIDQIHHASQRTDLRSSFFSELDFRVPRVRLIRVDALRTHEEIFPKRLDKLVKKFEKFRKFYEPIMVDMSSLTILDGHHRHAASIKCGLKYIPAIVVDYINDERIKLDVWPECGLDMISKEEIISKGLCNENFHPKTSKHTTEIEVPKINIPFEELQ